MERVIQQVLDRYPDKVKLVVKNFPLSSHRFARKAAQAAMAAWEQGKFWEYRRELFENYRSLSDAKILDIAKSLGLDMTRFTKDMNSPSTRDFVDRDVINGRLIGVRGTPSIFVNGKPVKFHTPFDLFTAIDAELKKGS